MMSDLSIIHRIKSWKFLKKLNNYPGNYEQYLAQKQAKYDQQLKDYETQQKELETTGIYRPIQIQSKQGCLSPESHQTSR